MIIYIQCNIVALKRDDSMKAYYYLLTEEGSKIEAEEVEKMYDASLYKLGKAVEKERPKEGDRIDDKVTEIVNGTRKELMRNWENFKLHVPEANPDEPCIRVVAGCKADLVIALPKTPDAHPKSKMGAWIRTYRSAPQVGQKIQCMADENGYYRIVLLA